MISIAYEFILATSQPSQANSQLRLLRALKTAEQTFLSYPQFQQPYEICNVYNYYQICNKALSSTPLHQEVMTFWEAYQPYHNRNHSGYILITTCQVLTLFNHLIHSCSDEAYIYRELINSFGKYFDLLGFHNVAR